MVSTLRVYIGACINHSINYPMQCVSWHAVTAVDYNGENDIVDQEWQNWTFCFRRGYNSITQDQMFAGTVLRLRSMSYK